MGFVLIPHFEKYPFWKATMIDFTKKVDVFGVAIEKRTIDMPNWNFLHKQC